MVVQNCIEFVQVYLIQNLHAYSALYFYSMIFKTHKRKSELCALINFSLFRRSHVIAYMVVKNKLRLAKIDK